MSMILHSKRFIRNTVLVTKPILFEKQLWEE